MSESAIAVITQHPTYSPGLVVVVNNQWFLDTADYALRDCRLDVCQRLIRNHVPELTPAVCIPVLAAARTAPAIQPVPLLVMRRKELRCRGFLCFATSTSQQFHALSDNAFRVGFPFSSFIGPGIPDIRAQKLALRPASSLVFGFGAGGFSPGLPGLALL